MKANELLRLKFRLLLFKRWHFVITLQGVITVLQDAHWEFYMEIFGWLFGTAGMVIALLACARVDALEKKLKEKGVLDPEFNSEKETQSPQ